MASKEEIRKQILSIRERTPKLAIEQKSGIICKRVTRLAAYQKADTIYTYVSMPKEVSTFPLIDAAWKDGKRVAVPKVTGDRMRFIILNSYEQLEEGHFHVLEPKFGLEADDKQALLIMPGVAFDRHCHRIGYGKGYYDRFLKEEPSHDSLALAFAFSLLPEIPQQETDICPRRIVTEGGIIENRTGETYD